MVRGIIIANDVSRIARHRTVPTEGARWSVSVGHRRTIGRAETGCLAARAVDARCVSYAKLGHGTRLPFCWLPRLPNYSTAAVD